MRKTALILSLFLSGLLCAQGTNNLHKSYIEIGVTGGTYAGTGAIGGVYGAAGLFFKAFGLNSALDFRAKEAYISAPEREAGAITVTYRVFLNRGFFVGAGFAHNHEIAWNNYLNDIAGATLGNSKNIIHRSGIAAEAGYNARSFIRKGGPGIYPMFGLGVSYLVLDSEPNPFLTLSAGFRFGFKRLPEAQ